MNGYTARVRATLAAVLATLSAAALIWEDVTGASQGPSTAVTAAILVVSLQVLAFPVENVLSTLRQFLGRGQDGE